MPRPGKFRCIETTPRVRTFKPQGIPLSQLKQVTLTLDEFEALRLADLEGDTQEQAAARMNVSRPTFGRIIEKARHTFVDALVNGKAIQVEGGNYTVTKVQEFSCRSCRQTWHLPLGPAVARACPRCQRKDPHA
jgi:predicted DNA-binding protein (UPF0251 family)